MIGNKRFQTITLLSLLLIVFLFLEYQSLSTENKFLKLKVKEFIAQNKYQQKKNTEKTISLETKDLSHISQIKKESLSQEAKKTHSKSSIITNGDVEINVTQIEENKTIFPFAEQEIDYDWALPVENAITDAFMTHNYLVNYTLENVECRTSICEFTLSNVSIDSMDAALTVMFAFKEIDVLNEKTQTFRQSRRLEDGTLKLFVGRFKNNFN